MVSSSSNSTTSGLQVRFSGIFLAFLLLSQNGYHSYKHHVLIWLHSEQEEKVLGFSCLYKQGNSLHRRLICQETFPRDPLVRIGSCAYVLCAKDPGKTDIWHILASLMVLGFCHQGGSLGERLVRKQTTVSATVYRVAKTVAGKYLLALSKNKC